MTSSISVQKLVVAVVITAVLIPVFSAAAQTPGEREVGIRAAGAAGAAFCSNLDTVKERMAATVAERKAKRGDNQAGRGASVETRKEDRLARLETNRDKADAVRDVRYERLEAAATTDEQVAAVAAFKATVEDLTAERRAAVDAAVAVFESTVEALKSELSDATDMVAAEITTAIEAAFADVAAACEADDVDVAVVRADLKAALEAARTDVAGTREAFTLREDFDAAKTVMQAAVEAAKADFEAGLEAAKAELKSAFDAV